VSSSVPTARSTLTVAANSAGRLSPSRFSERKPVRLKVTVYTPGRRSTTLYTPCASVTADRTPSMSTGLAASTVTPGSTPPEQSRTTPRMLLCADAATGSSRNIDNAATHTSPRARIRDDSLRIPNPESRIPSSESRRLFVVRAVADVLSVVHDLGRRTDHFHHVEVRRCEGQRHLVPRHPRSRVGLWIVERHGELHQVAIDAVVALLDLEIAAVRVAR